MEWLSRIDRRWLYLVMAVVITVPFLTRTTFEGPPSQSAKDIYEAIESLPPGAVVLVSADYDPGSEAEIFPMNLALFHQLGRKDVRVICTQLWPQAGPLVEDALRKAYYPHGKKYGADFVNLGYKSGGQLLINKMVESIRTPFPTDVHGTPVDRIPAMRGVKSLKDVDLVVSLSAGTPGTKEWVQQAQAKLGFPLAAGVTAVTAPDIFAYLNTGQLIGILGGLRGAADYETLVGKRGRGYRGMGPQTSGHMLIVIFIVLGNIGYLLSRRKARGGG